jgi:hypothetical protein
VFEALEPRTLLAGDISLVRYFDTWTGPTDSSGGLIGSADPGDFAYDPGSGHLILADPNIDETPGVTFNGENMFEISLAGDQVFRKIVSNNLEATGITYNAFDGFFYVTRDTGGRQLVRYNSDLNAPLAIVNTTDALATATDPEDVTSDPATGFLYVADGVGGGRQVLVYDSQLVFQSSFSVAPQIADPEGIAFHPTLRHLFISSKPDRKVFEYTLGGTLVNSYDLSAFSPNIVHAYGLEFAPTSDPGDPPAALSLYIADRGVGNYPDGRVFEAQLGGLPTDVEVQVSAKSDDAEEMASLRSVNTTDGRLKLGFDSSREQLVGIRFNGVAIPPHATIVNAYVQFQNDENKSAVTSLTIRGQAADQAAAFTATSGNISSRPAEQTPDISAVIQEIVSRPGWISGNSLALIITGTGVRSAASYDRSAAAAPVLRIAFSDSPPSFTNPVLAADVNADGAVTPKDVLILINRLNAEGSHTLTGTPTGVPYTDVNRDLQISASDVLQVINYINSENISRPTPAAEPATTDVAVRAASAADPALPALDYEDPLARLAADVTGAPADESEADGFFRELVG